MLFASRSLSKMRAANKSYRVPPQTVKKPEVPVSVPELWMEKLAWLMDNSIPAGRKWSIGLDGLLGLFPGVGDLAGAFISALIVARATQMGLPRSAIARMLANVAIDSLLGVIPVVGDLFDFVYKANSKNLQIYREALAGRRPKLRDWMFLFFIVLALLVLGSLPIAALFYLVKLL